MAIALVGHTGFVGGVLARAMTFDEFYNSENIESIQGRSFERIVCAGTPGHKGAANRTPDADRGAIARLQRCLASVHAERVHLVSTIDVYPEPRRVDEDDAPNASDLHPYGRHRLELEGWLAATFPKPLSLRLPALFGPGLKKNFVYDLLSERQERFTDHRSRFQFYDVTNLAGDMDRAANAGLEVVNLVTEPVDAATVALEVFGIEYRHVLPGGPADYDVRTRHAGELGGSGPYLRSASDVLDSMRRWVASEREP